MRFTAASVRIVAPCVVAAAASAALTLPMPPRGSACAPALPPTAPLRRCSRFSTLLLERGPRFAPSTPSSAIAPLSSGAVELLLEDVVHVDGGDAQQLAHVVATEAAHVERRASQLDRVREARPSCSRGARREYRRRSSAAKRADARVERGA